MNSKIKLFLGLLAFTLMIGLNSKHALNSYGLNSGDLHLNALAATTSSSSSSSSGSSGSSGSSSSSAAKVKTCRKVSCCASISINADTKGCITLFNKTKCLWSANFFLTISGIPGNTENCTGGSQWEDCDACQQDCVMDVSNCSWW